MRQIEDVEVDDVFEQIEARPGPLGNGRDRFLATTRRKIAKNRSLRSRLRISFEAESASCRAATKVFDGLRAS